MSSKRSNLIPIVAITAATATTCAAYYFLKGKKQQEQAPPKPSKKNDDNGGRAAEKVVVPAPSNNTTTDKETPVFGGPSKDNNQHEETPNLANVSTCEDSGSDSEVKQEEPAAPVVVVNETKEAEEIPTAVERLTANTPPEREEGPTPKKNEEEKTKEKATPTCFEKIATNEAVAALPSVETKETVVKEPETPQDESNKMEILAAAAAAADIMEPAESAAADPAPTSETKNEQEGSKEGGLNADNKEATTDETTKEGETAAPETPVREKKDPQDVATTPASLQGHIEEIQEEDDEKKVEVKESDLWEFLQKEMQQNRKCAGCNVEEGNEKFKPCAKCRSVLYCGRACQKKHWKQHKKFCCK